MLKNYCKYGVQSKRINNYICKKTIENIFGKHDMVLTLSVAIAMLSFNTLALTVASATVSVNILKNMLQVWRSVIMC